MQRMGIERFAVSVAGLIAMVAVVCAITLSPSTVDAGHGSLTGEILAFLHSKGVPQWFGYNKLEFTANILMFVPLGLFAGLLLPIKKVWLAGFGGTTFSLFIEVFQFFFLPERYATVPDVLANTIGGWVGIGIAVLLRLLVQHRDRRLHGKAPTQPQNLPTVEEHRLEGIDAEIEPSASPEQHD